MKVTVVYQLERKIGRVWFAQANYEEITKAHALKKMQAWMRGFPADTFRLVRVTTTEEREVVG